MEEGRHTNTRFCNKSNIDKEKKILSKSQKLEIDNRKTTKKTQELFEIRESFKFILLQLLNLSQLQSNKKNRLKKEE